MRRTVRFVVAMAAILSSLGLASGCAEDKAGVDWRKIDACALVTDEELAAYLTEDEIVQPIKANTRVGSSCTWGRTKDHAFVLFIHHPTDANGPYGRKIDVAGKTAHVVAEYEAGCRIA